MEAPRVVGKSTLIQGNYIASPRYWLHAIVLCSVSYKAFANLVQEERARAMKASELSSTITVASSILLSVVVHLKNQIYLFSKIQSSVFSLITIGATVKVFPLRMQCHSESPSIASVSPYFPFSYIHFRALSQELNRTAALSLSSALIFVHTMKWIGCTRSVTR